MTDLTSEYKPLIAQEDGRVLIHTVLLPSVYVGFVLCEMSNEAFRAYPDGKNTIYYRLMPEKAWSAAARQITRGSCDDVDKIQAAEAIHSYPHLTLFHAWMTAEDAENYVTRCHAAVNDDKIPSIEKIEMTGQLHLRLPHWYNTRSIPERLDDIYWAGVAPELLWPLQRAMADIALTQQSCTIGTKIGQEWTKPHFTTLGHIGAPKLKSANFSKTTYYCKKPTLAIGVSGSNGQFRAPVALLKGPNQSTRPDVAIGRLRQLLTLHNEG